LWASTGRRERSGVSALLGRPGRGDERDVPMEAKLARREGGLDPIERARRAALSP
jgi:hypothetical protein